MKPEMKKLIIANLPYLLFVYLFGKLGQTYRLAAGADLSEKLLHLADGFSLAFESAAPSFHLFDLAVGVAGAVALRLMVYCKSKNAKKYRRGVEYGSARWGGPKDIGQAKCHFDPADVYDFKLEDAVDLKVLEPRLGKALTTGTPARLEAVVSSTDRAVGTILGSDVTRLHGKDLPDGTFTVKCTGGGGQSFGAFLPQGITLELEGDANDYLGKGLSGGTIVVYPPKESPFDPAENILVGNVALYGATSGRVFLCGTAGERFCVRNSGAVAVVEGVGDHGCEYMTGGRVVVLGSTGKNFAAGMSGGVAYVLDEKRDLYLRLNKALVSMSPVTEPEDTEGLRELIQAHADATGSARAREILDRFSDYLPLFKKILPHDYDRMLRTIASFRAQGMGEDEAQVEAFYANTRKGGE